MGVGSGEGGVGDGGEWAEVGKGVGEGRKEVRVRESRGVEEGGRNEMDAGINRRRDRKEGWRDGMDGV